MSRFIRSVVAFAVALAALLSVVLGCGSGKPELFVYNWIDYIPDSVIMEFEKRYDVKVHYDMFSTNEEMYAKLKASGGAGFDIVFPSGDFASIMIKEGMCEEIDKSLVPNIKNLDESVLAKIEYDPELKYSVPFAIGTAGISINTEKVQDFENSWKVFEHPSVKGRMTLLNDMREVLGAALKTLGYSVNSIVPAELEEAKALVLEWKKAATKFDSEAFGEGFARGEFFVCHGYAENVFTKLKDNEEMRKNAKFFIPKEGGPMYIDNMMILKGAKNIDLAYKFINFIHEPEIYAQIMDFLELPSMNVPAREHMTETPHYQIEDLANSELKEDLGTSLEMYNKIWQEIMVGK